MIKSAIIAGILPDQLRGMIPKDAFLIFEGWREAHTPPEAGSGAMTHEEYKALVRKVDGGNG